VAKSKQPAKSVPKPKSTATKGKNTTKKVFADHNDNAEDSGMDVDEARGVSDAGAPGPSNSSKKKVKTASETYTMVCTRLMQSAMFFETSSALTNRTYP